MIGYNSEIAKKFLEDGRLVAIPTETVYGLAANAYQENSVLKIFEAKNRPTYDPLILHYASPEMLAQDVLNIPEKAHLLMEAFWPGPLTLLLPKKKHISDLITAGSELVAVRIPKHSLTLSLLESLQFPLAAPSANPFGYVSPTTAEHVEQQLGDKIPYILDGGTCEIGLESSIVGFEDGKTVLYRAGGLTKESIESIIGPIDLIRNSNSKPSAPGMLLSHYAPRKPVYWIEPHAPLPDPLAARLSFQTSYQEQNNLVLSPSGNLKEAAKHLFAYLRLLDNSNVSSIYVEKVPNEGLGLAINDRLTRATYRK